MRRGDKSRKLSHPIPVRDWLAAADFMRALQASKIDRNPTEDTLRSIVSLVREAVREALLALRLPDPSGILGVASELRALTKGNLRVLARLLLALSPTEVSAGHRDAVILAIELSDMTVIVALLGAACAEVGRDDAAAALADAILNPDERVRRWASAASAQYIAGAKAVREARQDVDRRKIAEKFGGILIGTYVDLTGRHPSISRVKPDAENAGMPSGPLIRYLGELYRRLRERLNADGLTRDVAGERIWAPSAETLVAWVERYRHEKPLV